jgi:hypothetical protein
VRLQAGGADGVLAGDGSPEKAALVTKKEYDDNSVSAVFVRD